MRPPRVTPPASPRRVWWCLLLILPMVAAEGRAAAQRAPDSPPDEPQGTHPDFFLRRPLGTIGVRTGWLFAREGSDLFDFVERQLTIDDGAFSAPSFTAELGIALTPRVDIVLGLDASKASVTSEYRDYVDNNRLPIVQTTSLKQVNVSGSVRFAVLPRVQGISRFAWIPRRVTPYVGAGAGAMRYEFRQTGDFVDFVDLSVFADNFVAQGWAPSAHVFGGGDIQIYRRLFLSLEGRYIWAAADLGRTFVDFDPIDLAGFRLGAGVNIVF
jgi:hypothetical protein